MTRARVLYKLVNHSPAILHVQCSDAVSIENLFIVWKLIWRI